MRHKTTDEIIDKIVEVLTEDHLETCGGYPYAYQYVGDDTLVVASLDYDGATELEVFTKEALLEWVDEMRAMFADPAYAEEYQDDDWSFFVNEARSIIGA